jgi:hypothetical protein
MKKKEKEKHNQDLKKGSNKKNTTRAYCERAYRAAERYALEQTSRHIIFPSQDVNTLARGKKSNER